MWVAHRHRARAAARRESAALDGGLEYLFGFCFRNDAGEVVYEAVWGRDRDGERVAFEQFVVKLLDFLCEGGSRSDETHVAHQHVDELRQFVEFEKLFDVNVTAVRTMQMRRNEVTRGKTRGTTARWKKAIVTLRDGQTLPVFEG